ncbi:hypothetical protein GCM10009836_52330 [Pseudonocardia ailaonensis]|uniref:Phosphatidic acid phosphatase type 2/haloperoxidase domain-containing protein n=1 Tax=Pseudonocardia ailaonensis TaxID=367279 RepID=A0ABN2NF37_9PSEU
MKYADLAQWVSLGLFAAWLAVAALGVAGRRPRLSPSVLRGTGLVAALLVLQSWVVDAVADPDGLSAADEPLLAWFVDHRSPGATAVLRVVTDLGGTLGMAALTAVTAVVLLVRRHLREAVVVVVAGIGAGVLVAGLKSLYARPRPPLATRLVVETNPSLPSGHALSSAVVVGIVAAVLVAHLPRLRAVVTAIAAAAVLAIGVSRLYLGVHWLTDVLDGWLVGGAWLTLCVLAMRAAHTVPERSAAVEVSRASLP